MDGKRIWRQLISRYANRRIRQSRWRHVRKLRRCVLIWKNITGSASIVDIAQQTGFTDQSHFTGYFRDIIGLTPSQYQNIFERE